MAFNIKTSLELFGDKALFERVSTRLRNPKPFMRQVGIVGAESARRRLSAQLGLSDRVSSGRLLSSLNFGDPSNIFNVSELIVEFGTNLRYAAQRQFGGIILPRNAKALAIPLKDSLKRDGISPREIEGLIFKPAGKKANVFGVLIAPDDKPTRFGTGPLFALAWWVNQPARPFMFWDEADYVAIRDDLLPLHLHDA